MCGNVESGLIIIWLIYWLFLFCYGNENCLFDCFDWFCEEGSFWDVLCGVGFYVVVSCMVVDLWIFGLVWCYV